MVFTRERLLVFWLLIAIQSAAGGALRAAQDEVAVEVKPTAIEFAEKREVPAIVVLRNPTDNALDNVRLSSFSDTFVDVLPPKSSVAKLAAGAEFAWQLVLSRDRDTPVSGTVYLRVDYVVRGEDAATDSTRVKLASIAVSTRDLTSVSDIASVEAKTTLVSLTEQSPGKVYLVVTNKFDVPITVGPVAAGGPSFVEFGKSGENTRIEPHQERALTIDVTARSRVRPGKHMLLFEVPLKWKRGEKDYSGNVAVAQEVEVGVLGESAVLKLLGLPSFLLLPGFLWIATFGFAWNRKLFRPGEAGEFPLKGTTADFWLVAISISILSVFVYRGIVGHDYLESYGLNDLVRIWGGAVVAGLLCYLITVSGMRLYGNLRKVRAAGRTPATEDEPLDVLRKLQRLGLGLELETAKITIAEQELSVFLLQPFEATRAKTWVGPTIEFEWKDGSDELRTQAHGMLQPPFASPGDLAEMFERGKNEGLVELSWLAAGSVQRPREVDTAQLKRLPGRRPVVQRA